MKKLICLSSLTLLLILGMSTAAFAGGVVVKNGPRKTVVVHKRPCKPATVVVVKKRPAPRVVVVKPRRPSVHHVWVAGHWKYTRRGRVWVPGHWAR